MSDRQGRSAEMTLRHTAYTHTITSFVVLDQITIHRSNTEFMIIIENVDHHEMCERDAMRREGAVDANFEGDKQTATL